MKCADLTLFQKKLKDPFTLCLVLAKEENDRSAILSLVLKDKKEVISFSFEGFSKERFFQELETLSFLTKQKTVLLVGIDELDKESQDALSEYCAKPNSWISLILSASHLTSQNKILKACEKEGIIYVKEEEKPWEKEKRIEKELIEEAKKEGVEIEPTAAHYLAHFVEPSSLKNEFNKLICYAKETKRITLQDVKLLSHFHSQETLFQLADAIFQRNKENAFGICEHLIENESDAFLILAGLRSQIQMAYQALLLYQEEGKSGVTKAFPYLKGGFLDKKLKFFQEYGLKRLKKALFLLFETEIRLKNLPQDPKLIFEILLSKLLNDTLSSSQFARAFT